MLVDDYQCQEFSQTVLPAKIQFATQVTHETQRCSILQQRKYHSTAAATACIYLEFVVKCAFPSPSDFPPSFLHIGVSFEEGTAFRRLKYGPRNIEISGGKHLYIQS